ncbi:MAG: HipA domain-containing protein [Lentisphaeria bacterium]|nr:HipA domain-containing protein [Lentisphaeria bacterium]
MRRCLITYEEVAEDEHYSGVGLRKLSPRLTSLAELPYSAEEQRRESAIRVGRMSIQGMQPKLSACLEAGAGRFKIVDTGGRYLIKPQNSPYPELPENEDLTMRLAEIAGIETPLHGLLRSRDGSRSYFIRRFDRQGKRKFAVEDFAQLAGGSRETKYDSSVEKIFGLLRYCTFPVVECVRLYRRCLFNFLVGNEDMHLKNYSVITRGRRTELAPAYDYLNSVATYLQIGTLLDDIEETALPVRGRKRKLKRSDWVDYLALERLQIQEVAANRILSELEACQKEWSRLIEISFLSKEAKQIYRDVLARRRDTLFG